jgi:hypothetical protein
MGSQLQGKAGLLRRDNYLVQIVCFSGDKHIGLPIGLQLPLICILKHLLKQVPRGGSAAGGFFRH